jgi:hypothetical protein
LWRKKRRFKVLGPKIEPQRLLANKLSQNLQKLLQISESFWIQNSMNLFNSETKNPEKVENSEFSGFFFILKPSFVFTFPLMTAVLYSLVVL